MDIYCVPGFVARDELIKILTKSLLILVGHQKMNKETYIHKLDKFRYS